MKLLEFIVELKDTVKQLTRIADALERISPPMIDEGPPPDLESPGVITTESNRNWEYYADPPVSNR